MSAFVIGAMAPDFEYLLRLGPGGGFAHSPRGLVLFCIPAGLVVFLCFRSLVAPALLRVTPPGLATALETSSPAAPRRLGWWFIVALAIFAGAVTHVFWDGFTHWNGWAAEHLHVLREPVAGQLAPRLRWYAVLQHGSTLLGGLVVIGACAKWLRAQPREARTFAPGQRAQALRLMLLLILSATAGGILNGARGRYGRLPAKLGYGAVGVMAALAVALLVYGLVDRGMRSSDRA